jgi:hypothetical protein
MSMYDDVYIRANWGDTGEMPVKDGGWTCSPDIIPNGPNLLPDPVKTLTETWDGPDLGKETVLQQMNYFYVRGKNLFDGERKGTFELYYCPENLFLFPSMWRNNRIETSDGKDSLSVIAKSKGDILVPNQPFRFQPMSSIHNCLICRVITEGHPNPLPGDGEITGMTELANYILDHPNMAWRNVALVQRDIPTFVRDFNLDMGDDEGRVHMYLECKNVKGGTVAFSCGTPIPSGPDQGKVIELKPAVVPQEEISLGSITYTIPANFVTRVSYSYWAQPPIEKDWSVDFKAILLQSSKDKLYHRAQPLSAFGLKDLYAADGGIEKGIAVGSISTQGKAQV